MCFKLPDEFNFIKIFQQVTDDGKSSYGEKQALGTLASIFGELLGSTRFSNTNRTK